MRIIPWPCCKPGLVWHQGCTQQCALRLTSLAEEIERSPQAKDPGSSPKCAMCFGRGVGSWRFKSQLANALSTGFAQSMLTKIVAPDNDVANLNSNLLATRCTSSVAANSKLKQLIIYMHMFVAAAAPCPPDMRKHHTVWSIRGPDTPKTSES